MLSGHWFPPHYRCPDWQIHAELIVYQTFISSCSQTCLDVDTLLLYCIVVPILIIVSVISCFVLLRAVAGHSLADCKHRAVRFIGGFRQQRPR